MRCLPRLQPTPPPPGARRRLLSTSGQNPNTLRRPVPSGTYAWRDLPYYTGQDHSPTKHCLDIYIASQPFPRPLQPVCLFVHGGFWVRGDRHHHVLPNVYDNIGAECARHGFVGAIISYRLSPEVQHPEHCNDVSRALRWTVDQIRRFGGDPHQIFLIGHSAGAHLCANLLCDLNYLQEQELPLSTTIKGFVGISGVYNLLRLGSFPVGVPEVLPYVFGDRSRWAHASPVHQAAGLTSSPTPNSTTTTTPSPKSLKELPIDKVPVLLLNAEMDFHLKDDAKEFIEVLRARPHTQPGLSRDIAVVQGGTDHMSVVTTIGNTTTTTSGSTSKDEKDKKADKVPTASDYIFNFLKRQVVRRPVK